MPKRNDIHRILIIGSGPIVIGQACEFDYSGTQACKALRAEGFEVVLVNSNPATIMTDPEMAERTYVEPLTREYLEAIIERERPDALLPTVGGQTALNLAMQLFEGGVLDRHRVLMIGASPQAIQIAEDRLLFKDAMRDIELETPRSGIASNAIEAAQIAERIGFPVILRPSFTLGGTGGGTAYNTEEFHELITRGLMLSPVRSVLIEESLIGWKEYELEVMRDLADNVVIICSIENLDPMGVHTGDSITVAPAQTLTDKEYQRMRDAAIAIIRKVGVETGGSNIQFAINPGNGRMVVIEMNPRVSRSSALASKATGFPIAKIAAKLAVGYTLDEIPNDITQKTPASFEPSIDYVVAKIPKWAFEKFPGSDPTLGTQMKSVGEVMAIGRTFKEALFKGLRSLEAVKPLRITYLPDDELRRLLSVPSQHRLRYVIHALQIGWSIEELFRITMIDPWFLHQIRDFAMMQNRMSAMESFDDVSAEMLRDSKRMGFSDRRIAHTFKIDEFIVRHRRKQEGIVPVFKRVDTCAAEFESYTPYLYSTYETEDESAPTSNPKIMILGSGPNRIGQGIEFDYCCCHAAFALKELGYETLMVNCNPETVSTDYDTSDRLYFEPLTLEDVLSVVENEKPAGVIVQFGGQTPLNLALPLKQAGVPIIGTDPENIDLAEDRKRFGALLRDLNIPQPENGTATSIEEARVEAKRIGYPVLVRPSYVLGGRAMVIAYDEPTLDRYMREAVDVSQQRPILIDRFLEDAFEFDVDALADAGGDVVIAGIMEHIEEAGIHSGDSSCVLPAYLIKPAHLATIRTHTRALARALHVVGLMNVQFAMKDDLVHVLEVNPRASRTVPYVSKATGVPLAKIAAQLMVGRSLKEFNLPEELPVDSYFVKSPVFPFSKFPGVDTLLGPEMKSTGEVMGCSDHFGMAFAKAQLSAGVKLPTEGTAFISVNDHDKKAVIRIAQEILQIGFALLATRGTAEALRGNGLEVQVVNKVNEGRPNIADLIKSGKVQLVINTPLGRESFYDEKAIRSVALNHAVPCITTLSAAAACVEGIRALQQRQISVKSLQEYHGMKSSRTSAVSRQPSAVSKK
ncbi:MAG: carbamoyl-phosphate synthase large subunit [Acidobacteriia bacterium]|nr:carbamoyl-phosphate synthase large subunit [Terriglobia bacterium]